MQYPISSECTQVYLWRWIEVFFSVSHFPLYKQKSKTAHSYLKIQSDSVRREKCKELV